MRVCSTVVEFSCDYHFVVRNFLPATYVVCVMYGQKFQRIQYDTLRYAPPLCVSIKFCILRRIVRRGRVPYCFRLVYRKQEQKLSLNADL